MNHSFSEMRPLERADAYELTAEPLDVACLPPFLEAMRPARSSDVAPMPASLEEEMRASIDRLVDYVDQLEGDLRRRGTKHQRGTVASLRREAATLRTMMASSAEGAAPQSGVQARIVAVNDNVSAGLGPSEDGVVLGLERRSRFIQKTFARYLSEDIVAKLLDSPNGLELGGERRRVTILMSDLRGFTSLTEGMEPERMMQLLNNYLGEMARIIVGFGGTIIEFIGDAVFALFGTPSSVDADAGQAVACALEMQRAMTQVNAAAAAEGLPRLQMGIALHTGDVVVGNIGSEVRAKYGAVGSAVNLASRIQTHAAASQILISDSTLRAAGCEAKVRATFSIAAKGFADPVTIHELRGARPVLRAAPHSRTGG